MRWLSFVTTVVLGVGPAFAQQTRTVDIDGDGAADRVAVGANGAVTVATARGGPGAPPATARLERPGAGAQAVDVDLAEVDGHRVLVVRAALPGAQTEALLLEWQKGKLGVVWRGVLGPQGPDGEWSRLLEVTPRTILLYEERPGWARCDERRAQLYPKSLRYRARKAAEFEPAALRAAAGGSVAVLRAQRGAAPPGLDATTTPKVFRFAAASSQLDARDAGSLAPPRELDDGRLETRWVEGQPGDGRGDFVTARAGGHFRLLALRMVPGDAASARAFAASNRLKRVQLVTSDRTWTVDFPADPAAEPGRHGEPYWVIFPQPVATTCVSVVIDAVYPGQDRNRTAVSEIAALTDLDAGGAGGLAGLAEDVARGATDASNAERLLRDRGAAGTQALVAAARKPDRAPEERRRLRLAIARIGDPAGAEELVRGLKEAGPGGGIAEDAADGEHFAAGLRTMRDGAVPALAILLGDAAASLSARLWAARLLGASRAAEARAALLAVLGQGDRPIRHAAISALGTRGAADLPGVLAAARAAEAPGGREAREADLWRVAALLCRHVPRGPERTAAAQAVAVRLGQVSTYELRYRLLQAAAILVEEPEAAAVLDTALRARALDPALRKVAVESLAGAARQAAAPFLALAFTDADPAVRAAAVEVERSASPAGDPAPLFRLLAGDPWPLVRRAAAEALSDRCAQRPAADALYQAVSRDRDRNVQRLAMTALVRCREPRIGPRLVSLVGDHRVPPDVRQYAASLLGTLGDRRHVPRLIELLGSTRREAFASEAAVRVAATVARTLGVLGDPRAGPALLEALGDRSIPFVQAAAAGAVGQLCPPGGPAALRKAGASDEAVVRAAVRQALARCR